MSVKIIVEYIGFDNQHLIEQAAEDIDKIRQILMKRNLLD